jgi:GxxExxY protein
VKTVGALRIVHRKQVLRYLRYSGLHKGLLLNFNADLLEIQSVVL